MFPLLAFLIIVPTALVLGFMVIPSWFAVDEVQVLMCWYELRRSRAVVRRE
ncbi:hypothetical protein [Geomicrobium sp. JCM 19055]|uniref:hypothetical protein n=1 Tax=Geomicrobium sp. JCM 19055 TaxID=1460649 RepID=UPI002235C04C|nr:hypothetical protein [Geomicrobium sp. JCM 19055]